MNSAEAAAVGGVRFEEALSQLDPAVSALFSSDPGIRSVGITRQGDGFGFRAVRNNRIIRPLNAASAPLTQFEGIPVQLTEVPADVEALLRVPSAGPASPAAATFVPETNRHRPLAAGLQIQNLDDDVRQGVTEEGFIIIGTLGCFVTIEDKSTGFLSNNHVIAGENRGLRSKDRILQPGNSVFDPVEHVAILEDYIDLVTSPAGAKPHLGNVNYNVVDAGVARLVDGTPFSSGYLPFRSLAAPSGVTPAMYGDTVFKVGRTTGLTFGKVVDVATVVGPVPYDPGDCWFRRSIVVEGLNGTMFSDRGDSGSAVVKTSGEVIGLLYAGNGFQTYVCPIDEVLRSLKCSLV